MFEAQLEAVSSLAQTQRWSSSRRVMEVKDAALQSLPGRLLSKVFNFHYPSSMLKAVACCQHVHLALGEHLKAALRFQIADWVVFEEVNKPGSVGGNEINQQIGQILDTATGPYCSVQVDDQIATRSRFTLRNVAATVRAVHLHSRRELEIPSHTSSLFLRFVFSGLNVQSETKFSETWIPAQLVNRVSKGQSPLMAELGCPLLLREAVPAGATRPKVPVGVEGDCTAATKLRRVLEGTENSAGPTIVAWVDGADFTFENMQQVWEFSERVWASELFRRYRQLPMDDMLRMWNESQSAMVTILQEFPETTETIFHAESPAIIKPEDAARLAEAQWASCITAAPTPSIAQLALVLSFARTTQSLDRAMKRCDPGRRLCGMGQTLRPSWANHAKILVEGLTEEIWKRACQDAGVTLELRPFHAVIPADDLASILAEVQKIPRASRPRLKAGKEILEVPDLAQFGDISDNGRHESWKSGISTPEPSVSVADSGTSERCGQAFMEGLREKIIYVPLGPLNISRTFIHEPEERPITPRSLATESDPANGDFRVNPRLFAH